MAVEVGVTLGVIVTVGVLVGVGVDEANNPFKTFGLKLQLIRTRMENANKSKRRVFEWAIFIPRSHDQGHIYEKSIHIDNSGVYELKQLILR